MRSSTISKTGLCTSDLPVSGCNQKVAIPRRKLGIIMPRFDCQTSRPKTNPGSLLNNSGLGITNLMWKST
jgi:hypothetical protein